MIDGADNACSPGIHSSGALVKEGAAPAAARQCDEASTENLPTTGVIGELSGTLVSARAALSAFLELMSLEARRAGLALMWMVVLAVVAAVCFVSAWLGLMAALVMWAVSLGYLPLTAVIAVALINCGGGVLFIYRCVGMSHDLLFSATRRQLAGSSPVEPRAS